MGNIFNPEPGAHYDVQGNLIEKPATPVQETAQESVTTTETMPAVETPSTESASAPTTPSAETDWGAVLSEKTGGRVKTWEELTQKLTEEKPAISFSNEESKRIFDYLQEGKIDDVLQVYNEQKRLGSIKDMADADVIKLAMEYKTASLSPAEIHEEFISKYSLEKPEPPVEDDYIGEDDFAKAQKAYEKELAKYEKAQKGLDRKLKLEAAESREYLESLKKDIVLPDIKPAQTAQEPDLVEYEKAVQESQKFRQEYLSSLEKSVGDFKEIPFDINDEGVVFKGNFQINDEEKLRLKSLAENVIDNFYVPRYLRGENYDTNQMMQDLYWLNNKDKIVASAVKQAIAQDRLGRLKEQKNVDLNGQHRADFEPSKEVQVHEMAKAFFKAG